MLKSSIKLFGQLILIGGQVVGKIVSSAYKQALASKFNDLQLTTSDPNFLDAAKNSNIAKDSSSASSIKGIMSIDEASKVLNCSKNPNKEELVSVRSTNPVLLD